MALPQTVANLALISSIVPVSYTHLDVYKRQGLNSEGATSVKEFTGSLIKGAHIIFRPGKTLAELMKILSYQQVLTRAVAQSGAGGDSGDDPDKGSGGSGSDDDEAPDPTV